MSIGHAVCVHMLGLNSRRPRRMHRSTLFVSPSESMRFFFLFGGGFVFVLELFRLLFLLFTAHKKSVVIFHDLKIDFCV